jgi:hypothetical protein
LRKLGGRQDGQFRFRIILIRRVLRRRVKKSDDFGKLRFRGQLFGKILRRR